MIQRLTDFDAIVIGAGPAGTATAAILAESDKSVLILEKETFPRYHIGESLIPFNFFPLERLGMIPKLRESSFIKKYSVQFVGDCGTVSRPFYFDKHWEHPCSQTWQVERATFDQMLLDNALERGAEVRFGVTVKGLIEEDGKVVGVDTDQGAFRAPVTIDGSGRNSVAIKQLGWRRSDDVLKKIAMWTYFKGAKRDEGIDEGATTVAYVDGKNWFWYIPMRYDLISVGLVGSKDWMYKDGGKPQEIFDAAIQDNPWIADHLAGAEQVKKVDVTSDFSYRSEFCAKDGLVLTGDAFAFLDPVFSSGVFLALYSGVLAGETINALQGDYRGEHFQEYGKKFCTAIEAMRQLVYAFYNEDFNFGQLLKKYPDLRMDLTDCLIGNTEKDYDPLFSAVREFVDLPEPIAYGGPLGK